MDLAPFTLIDPCGYAGLPVLDLACLGVADARLAWDMVADRLAERLQAHLSA